MRFNRINLAVVAFLCVGAVACATLVVETGKKAWEDRSTQDQMIDTEVKAGILKRLTGKDKKLVLDVSTDVWEQRVLLTGTLDDPKVIKEVVKLAKADERLLDFYNEIQLVSTKEKEKRRHQQEEAKKKKEEDKQGGAGQTVSDFWIETKIKAQLLTATNVTSVNYRWRSVLNHAYIIGRADNKAERDKILQIIKDTKGVKSVKHFIEIKPT